MKIFFEAHATTYDNEAGRASGWNDVELSPIGREQAVELGKRYVLEELDAVFCSDLRRSYLTAQLAFPQILPEKLFIDWRLRECNYGSMTLQPSEKIEAERPNRIYEPFPNGESYMQMLEGRMQSIIADMRKMRLGQVLIISSSGPHYCIEAMAEDKNLESLVTKKFVWQPGWDYEI